MTTKDDLPVPPLPPWEQLWQETLPDMAWKALEQTRRRLSPDNQRVFLRTEFKRRMEAKKRSMISPFPGPHYDELYRLFVEQLEKDG